jgi:hypothetical protein
MVGQPFYTLAGLASTSYQFANVNVYSGTPVDHRGYDARDPGAPAQQWRPAERLLCVRTPGDARHIIWHRLS